MSEAEASPTAEGEAGAGAPEAPRGRFAGPKPWLYLAFALICVSVVGIALTARDMIAAFNRAAATGGGNASADLADGIAGALRWVIAGMLFFWPGVALAVIGFWKKYAKRPAREDPPYGLEDEVT